MLKNLSYANQHKEMKKIQVVSKNCSSNAMLLENLICVARKYLCVPATSSPVERLFSYSGYIFRPHRQRLTTNKLEKLTMLKTMKFVDNEININSKIVQHEDLD